MKMTEAINFLQSIRGEQEDHAPLVQFLQELEGRIEIEIHGKSTWKKSETLSVPAPYDRLYWLYLLYMTDMLNADKERYERSAAVFKEALDAYAHYYRNRVREVG